MITAFEDKLSLEQAILQTPEGRKAAYLDYYDTNTRSAYHCNTDICVERKKGMKVNKFATGLFRLYIRSLTLQNRYRLFRRFIRIMWEKSLPYFQGTTVTLQIHNKTVFANYGYTYPIICRKFPSYNMPLVELAYQTCLSKARAISVVDIGAAIGDTVLLLESSLPGKINSYYCIDGDSQFFSYLQQNLSFLPNAFFINALLAEEKSKIRNLVNIHPGTASAQGDQLIDSTTLDCLLEEGKIGNPDLIKIDVDGYDGKVLMGAKKTIIQYKPTLIFEWHPVICRDTRNNWTDHFASLLNYGYSIFIFYDNYGNFSHIMTHIDFKAIDYLAETLIERKNTHAVYYDIIALTRESSVDIKSLIMLNNARTLKSNYLLSVSNLHTMDMNLVIDASVYENKTQRGIARIFSNALPLICDLQPDLKVNLFFRKAPQIEYPYHPRIRTLFLDSVYNLRPWSFWKTRYKKVQDFLIQNLYGWSSKSIWFSTYFTVPLNAWHGKQIVFVHDMIYELFPNLMLDGSIVIEM